MDARLRPAVASHAHSLAGRRANAPLNEFEQHLRVRSAVSRDRNRRIVAGFFRHADDAPVEELAQRAVP